MTSQRSMFLACVLALAACSTEGAAPSGQAAPGRVTQTLEPTDAIDQELMVFLGQAKNFHHKAKVYASEGKLDDAIAAVRQILSLRYPSGAPEAEDVRLDARARLAKLLLNQNKLDEAMRVVSEGLAPRQRESFFVANLHTVQGEIHEALAAQYAADNQPAKADGERRAAIDAYDRSIQINEKIQKQLLEDR
ncbi:MAG: tetratricopeptide repeat protein [Kofleriaceae bacterium]